MPATASDQYNKTVIGGFVSPVHEKYGKSSLAPMHHRLNMVGLAVESSEWLELDPWECAQDTWTPTALALARMSRDLAAVPVAVGGAEPQSGLIKVMMVCGGDLLGTFLDIKPNGQPLWQPQHRRIILAENGIACIRREGTDLEEVRSEDLGSG